MKNKYLYRIMNAIDTIQANINLITDTIESEAYPNDNQIVQIGDELITLWEHLYDYKQILSSLIAPKPAK